MQVVGDRLGPVLPGVHGRVLTDEPVGPVGRRAVLVVLVECLAVVVGLVAEQLAERDEPVVVAVDEYVPVVVADLVTEVTEHRAVGLTHLMTHLLTVGIVGLCQVEVEELASSSSGRVRVERHDRQGPSWVSTSSSEFNSQLHEARSRFSHRMNRSPGMTMVRCTGSKPRSELHRRQMLLWKKTS